MRKKAKKILMSTALILTLCMFTACGNNNNAADEVDTNEENMTDENMTEDDNVDDIGNTDANDRNNGTDNNRNDAAGNAANNRNENNTANDSADNTTDNAGAVTENGVADDNLTGNGAAEDGMAGNDTDVNSGDAMWTETIMVTEPYQVSLETVSETLARVWGTQWKM